MGVTKEESKTGIKINLQNDPDYVYVNLIKLKHTVTKDIYNN